MNLDLSGKRALVCGASAGIGRACAMELAALGASVTIAARDAGRLAQARSELPTPGGAGQKHDTMVLDLSKPEEARQAAVLAVSGGTVFHILVNNTGGPPGGPMLDATPGQLQAAFNALVLSAHHLVQILVPGMKSAGYGRIINIESTSVKQPIPNLGLSNAIRAAAANWAKTLSQELGGAGITVNNVLPGYTDTERLTELFGGRAAKTGKSIDDVRREVVGTIPAARLGRPEEVAAAVAFLASPAGAYINGINLPVDGGRLGTL